MASSPTAAATASPAAAAADASALASSSGTVGVEPAASASSAAATAGESFAQLASVAAMAATEDARTPAVASPSSSRPQRRSTHTRAHSPPEEPPDEAEEEDDDEEEDDEYEDAEMDEQDASSSGRRNQSTGSARSSTHGHASGSERKRKRTSAAGSSASSHSSALADGRAGDDDDGDSQSQANRTARACSWCRRRKRKCDGAKPTCVWCLKGNLACSYPSALLKRGPQSGMMKKLKRKVEELEQQLSTVRVLPRSMVGGMDAPSTLSITAFLQRIRAAKSFHLAASASASGASLTHAQLHALTPQTAQAHAALRDRLYLASFLASFNLVLPILNSAWEAVYLRLLHDEPGSFTPPLHWTHQYASAIAMGALMHQDLAYANESASVARHVASALFDEAHTEVLRGLLLLSCLLLGLGQSSRASCYIAVANRMVYLLSRPPCPDVRQVNPSQHITSELCFPGTFPDATVPLSLPPTPASDSSLVPPELMLIYSLVEDLSSSSRTVSAMTEVGWDRVERLIMEKRRKHLQKQKQQSAQAFTASASDASAAAPAVVISAIPPPPAPLPFHSLDNDHMLTLGLECRHSSPDIFAASVAQVSAWKPAASLHSSSTPDLSVASLAVQRMMVFLTSFRGEFLQLVRPLVDATGALLPCASQATSLYAFERSRANTRTAVSLCTQLVDALSAVALHSPANTAAAASKAARLALSSAVPPRLHLLLLTQPSTPSGLQHSPPVLLLQSGESQLHALVLLLKAIFMHMLVLEQEAQPDTDEQVKAEAPQVANVSVAPPPVPTWASVILASNTATSFIDGHGLDLSYCAFYALLLHLNIQVKLKYVKQCMAAWKRSQKWQMQFMTAQAENKDKGSSSAADSENTPPAGVATLAAATRTLLDSLHYCHLDFSLLEASNQRWTTFSASIWRDAQERISELLQYLKLPVGAMSGGANAGAGVTSVAPVAATGASREAAVQSVLLEDALGVYDSIINRYPLFVPRPAPAAVSTDKKPRTQPAPAAESTAAVARPTRSPKVAPLPVAAKRAPAAATSSPAVQQAHVVAQQTNTAPFPLAVATPHATAVPAASLPYMPVASNGFGGVTPGTMSAANMQLYGSGGGMQLLSPGGHFMQSQPVVYHTQSGAMMMQTTGQQSGYFVPPAQAYQQYPLATPLPQGLTNNQLHGLGLKPQSWPPHVKLEDGSKADAHAYAHASLYGGHMQGQQRPSLPQVQIGQQSSASPSSQQAFAQPFYSSLPMATPMHAMYAQQMQGMPLQQSQMPQQQVQAQQLPSAPMSAYGSSSPTTHNGSAYAAYAQPPTQTQTSQSQQQALPAVVRSSS